MSLRNQYGRFMQAHELLPALGFDRGGHLPEEGFAPRLVESVLFRCLPAVPGKRKHRIEYWCECGRWIPYGRAGQHSKGHPKLKGGANG